MRRPAEVVLKAEHVRKVFDDHVVLDDVSFEVRRGETVVIMGGSGCGKSTTLRMVTGLDRPDAGSIKVFGEEIMGMGERDLDNIRKRFGILFQSGALFNSMNLAENVALPIRQHSDLADPVIEIMVRVKLEMVGLSGFEHLMPAEISGGMKKRVGLARAIALDPELVFYDEPSAGLDPIRSAVIDELILDLKTKMGMTSVVVTHHMDSAFKIADWMVMLHKGKVITQGTPQEIRNNPDPLLQQFVNGLPDGPIPMRTSKETYLATLAGVIENA